METDAPSLAARTDAAEAALRNVALSRPNALALLEAGVARLGEALAAQAAVALVSEALSDAYVRCAVWPSGARVDLVEVSARDVPALSAPRPTTLEGGVLAGLGHPHVLVVPVEGAAPGAFVLARDDAWTDACLAAAGRLGALFGTLWAWADAEARFQRTVADLDDALFTFGHADDGRRVYAFVTPQVEALTGLDPDALLAGDADWSRLVASEDRAAFQAHDARLRAGEPSRVEVRLRVHDETVWISERATPSVDAAGRPVAGGLLSDVTAQKEAEAQLDRARRIAERAAQTRMAFLRTVSHELRTPLGAIRGFADLLVQETTGLAGVPPEVAEFAGTIFDASGRALRLVTDLLDLSRLETGSFDLTCVPVDLGATARAVSARYAADLAARGVSLDLDVAAEPVTVQADPVRVEQVLDQLVSNAAQSTPAGRVTVRLVAEAGRARLSVVDQGAGLDEDRLDAVFEPFAQDGGLAHDLADGGLGLALASRLAQQMGGALRVASVVGEGSAFTLTLPSGDA